MTMLSELRNRLQTGKRPATRQPDTGPAPERAEGVMAWEMPAVERLYETRSQLSPVDADWRERTYQQLLKVMDLSLLDSLEPAEAGWQIREHCQRLPAEHTAPGSAAGRPTIIKQIHDEGPGPAPLEPRRGAPPVLDHPGTRHAPIYAPRHS